jgi:hypothetical protein
MDGGVTVQTLQRMSQYTRFYPEELLREVLDESEDAIVMSRARAALAARQIAQPRVRGFYGQLFRDWKAASRTCPWLERGIYVGRDGIAVACCMMKDSGRHNLGAIGGADESTVLGRRAELAVVLAEGHIPEVCTGCGVTKLITAAGGGPRRDAPKIRLPLV